MSIIWVENFIEINENKITFNSVQTIPIFAICIISLVLFLLYYSKYRSDVNLHLPPSKNTDMNNKSFLL